jgi:hypothetical protein
MKIRIFSKIAEKIIKRMLAPIFEKLCHQQKNAQINQQRQEKIGNKNKKRQFKIISNNTIQQHNTTTQYNNAIQNNNLIL